MKISKQAKPELCVSKDPLRTSLHSPYLDASNEKSPQVVATDGVTLVRIPVTIDPDEDGSGCIPMAALKHARKTAPRADESLTIAVLDATYKVRTLDGSLFERNGDDFPNWRNVIEHFETPGFEVILNAEALARIQQAMGSGAVKLRFPDPIGYKCRQAHVLPARTTKSGPIPIPGAFGVIATIRE